MSTEGIIFNVGVAIGFLCFCLVAAYICFTAWLIKRKRDATTKLLNDKFPGAGTYLEELRKMGGF